MRLKLSLAAVALLLLTAIVVYFQVGFKISSHAPDSQQREEDARRQLAFQSLTDRLPKGKGITPSKLLDSQSKERWEIFERNIASYQNSRAELLKALHEKTRRFFVESPGQGPGRELIPPEWILLDDYRYTNTESKQPGEPADFPLSPSETLSRVEPTDEFHFYHDSGMFDFFYPTGFGYVKDRGHVAGFKPHGFRYLGVPVHESKHWRVDHLYLIGILSHEQPILYLTDKLPSMEQIRQGKTRALDFFEETALSSLRDGEDLYIVRKGDTLRMLGALRATNTCQQCHDAQVGDLMGAFSYVLRPASTKADGDLP
jgi:hypothetical protein